MAPLPPERAGRSILDSVPLTRKGLHQRLTRWGSPGSVAVRPVLHPGSVMGGWAAYRGKVSPFGSPLPPVSLPAACPLRGCFRVLPPGWSLVATRWLSSLLHGVGPWRRAMRNGSRRTGSGSCCRSTRSRALATHRLDRGRRSGWPGPCGRQLPTPRCTPGTYSHGCRTRQRCREVSMRSVHADASSVAPRWIRFARRGSLGTLHCEFTAHHRTAPIGRAPAFPVGAAVLQYAQPR
jgi:hypothetical protein